MAFASKPTTEYAVVTGVANFNVILINPTREELDSHNLTMKESEGNLDTKEGVDRIRLDFFLKNDKLGVQRMSLWVEKSHKTSQNGNNQFINDYGQTCWAGSLEEAINKESAKTGNKWFKSEGARLAYTGEEQLIEFIKSWLSVPAGGIAKLDNIDSLFNGNVSEIKAIIKDYSDLTVQVYLYANDKGYQSVYTRHFERGANKNMKRWYNYFEGLTTKFDRFVGTEIKEAVITPSLEDSEPLTDEIWN